MIHVVLIIDVFVTFRFAYRPHGFITDLMVAMTLDGNLMLIFILSVMALIGMDATFGVQTAGLAVGVFIGMGQLFTICIGQGFATFAIVTEMILTSALLMTANTTHSYIPQLLNGRFGVSMATASIITLVFPVAAFYILRALVYSDPVKAVLKCACLAFLDILAWSIFTRSPGIDERICCDIKGECPLHFTITEFGMFACVTVTLVVVCLTNWCARTCTCCKGCCDDSEKKKKKNAKDDKSLNGVKKKDEEEDSDDDDEDDDSSSNDEEKNVGKQESGETKPLLTSVVGHEGITVVNSNSEPIKMHLTTKKDAN